MKKTKNAAKRSTQQPKELQQLRNALMMGICVNQEVDVVKTAIANDLRGEFLPDSLAEGLLEDTTPDWMSERLQAQMKNALRGFSKDMALEVADNLVDYYSNGVRHYTFIEHIDKLLNSLYNKIQYAASKQGISLPNHF